MYLKQDELEEVSEDFRAAKDILSKSNHPQGYLISEIENKEKEIIKYK